MPLRSYIITAFGIQGLGLLLGLLRDYLIISKNPLEIVFLTAPLAYLGLIFGPVTELSINNHLESINLKRYLIIGGVILVLFCLAFYMDGGYYIYIGGLFASSLLVLVSLVIMANAGLSAHIKRSFVLVPPIISSLALWAGWDVKPSILAGFACSGLVGFLLCMVIDVQKDLNDVTVINLNKKNILAVYLVSVVNNGAILFFGHIIFTEFDAYLLRVLAYSYTLFSIAIPRLQFANLEFSMMGFFWSGMMLYVISLGAGYFQSVSIGALIAIFGLFFLMNWSVQYVKK